MLEEKNIPLPRGEQRLRVHRLPPSVVERIAAGEVIERPASVVKELVENAIDAEAENIVITTEGGGMKSIVVADDGIGMGREDAIVALERHATSKIRSLEDLEAICTLGFRGEALPSIAAVSRMRIWTRPHDQIEGSELVVEGGVLRSVRPFGSSPGTRVEVKDLFFNLPARKKFLKSPNAESAQISDVLMRLALSRPGIRWSWVREGRKALELPRAKDFYERARQVFEDEPLVAIEGERDGIRLRAVLSAPERAHPTSSMLFLYVNGRSIRDRMLVKAIQSAYGSTMPRGQFPVGALALEIDPQKIDVNVHPQKAEVRFASPERVFQGVHEILASFLSSRPFVPSPPKGNEEERAASRDLGNSLEEKKDEIALFEASPQQREGLLFDAILRDGEEAQPSRYASLRPIGQVKGMYIVCEGPEGIAIIDQHAADERVRFAELQSMFRQGRVPRQALLAPLRLRLFPSELEGIENKQEVLDRMGFEFRRFGENEILLCTVPALLSRSSPEALFRAALAELGSEEGKPLSEAIDRALATMACHGAIRAGDALNQLEQEELLKAISQVREFSGHCPHGRPVVFEITFNELARRVGRK
ncbi:MAG: DNA mismatch repair endonuclease MutL [Deltaproteobacteria bacterium]|nr:DNA mismatch repair endonuclease MutL [Deltaproteobacteria bacterium]